MKNISTIFGAAWLTGALAFNGVPGTGVLRSLFLILGIGHLIWTIRTYNKSQKWPVHKPESTALLALTLWFVFQSFIFSEIPFESLEAIVTHWGKILLLIFMMVAFLAYSNNRSATKTWLIFGVFFSGFFHVIATLGYQIHALTINGGFNIGMSLFGNYGYISPYVITSFAILTADLLCRLTASQRLLPLPTWLIGAFIVLTLIAQGLLADKAGYLMSIILILFSAAIFTFRTHNRKPIDLWISIPVIIIAMTIPFTFANRWQNGVDAIGHLVSHNNDDNDVRTAFIGSTDPNHPINNIDASFYQRYLWGKAGLHAIASHPYGYGYDSIGFGRFIKETYNIQGAVSSHNGWIDFAIDNGIPGLFLLLLLTGLIIRRGWQSFTRHHNPAGLVLMFFVINYIGRCAIDGHLVGSRLTGFAIATAALWTAISIIQNDNQPD